MAATVHRGMHADWAQITAGITLLFCQMYVSMSNHSYMILVQIQFTFVISMHPNTIIPLRVFLSVLFIMLVVWTELII